MRCTGSKTGAKGSYKPVQIPRFPLVMSVPKPQYVFKIGKTFSSTKSDLQVESSLGTSKVPSVVSGDLEETIDLNASFDIT
jgi:hypothetical protein